MFRAALERGERIGAGPVLRAWRGMLLFLSRWFQIESLYKFNAKFCPEWVPRFLVFPGTRDRPRIGLAALEAEAFVVWPTVELRRIAGKRASARLRRCGGDHGGAWRRPRPTASRSRRLAPMTHDAAAAGRAGGRVPPIGLPGPAQRRTRCLVMGVVNVTPDSFSDGGSWLDPDAAVAHGLELAAQGADIVDVGGESTRPGAERVAGREELRRVMPVITALAAAGHAASAWTRCGPRWPRRPCGAGARMVNDVSGGLADPEMPRWSPRPACLRGRCTGAGTAAT